MKKLIALTIFALVSIFSVSSASVGRFVAFYVRDAETREELAGVTIIIDGYQIGATTGLDGRISIDGVPMSANTFTVSHIGYKFQTHDLLKVNSCLYLIDLEKE